MEDNKLAPDGASCISTQEYLDQILDAEISIAEQLSLLPVEDRQRILKQELVSILETYPEAAKVSKDIRVEAAQNIKAAKEQDPNYKPIERFTTEMGVDGMVHIIRDKGTVEEAYSLVAGKHNKPLTDLQEMSTREHYNRHEIIEMTERVVPAQMSKISEKGLYTMITGKTTINSMFDNTYTTMQILGELDYLRREVAELKIRQTVTETKVNAIESMSEIPKANKLAAINLKKMGYSNVRIAQELKVSTKTISRWLKDNEILLLM